jgi:CRP-like cAMP-binding protein
MRYPNLFKYAQSISANISANDWLEFEKLIKEHFYRDGSVVFKKGEKVSSCYIVVSGVFKVYYLNDSYREYIRSFHLPNDVIASFTETLNASPSKITVECISKGSLLEFSWESFVELTERNSIWQKIAFNILALNYTMKEQRELELLTMKALERYKILLNTKPEIFNLVPQHQIACYLGITPVALTRLKTIGRTSPKRYKLVKRSFKSVKEFK